MHFSHVYVEKLGVAWERGYKTARINDIFYIHLIMSDLLSVMSDLLCVQTYLDYKILNVNTLPEWLMENLLS